MDREFRVNPDGAMEVLPRQLVAERAAREVAEALSWRSLPPRLKMQMGSLVLVGTAAGAVSGGLWSRYAAKKENKVPDTESMALAAALMGAFGSVVTLLGVGAGGWRAVPAMAIGGGLLGGVAWTSAFAKDNREVAPICGLGSVPLGIALGGVAHWIYTLRP
jgi:hypothetical protein